MGGSKTYTKERLLAIERMFMTRKPLTVKQIIEKLDLEYDIRANRRAVYDDIAVLTMFMNIDRFGEAQSLRYQLIDFDNMLEDDEHGS